MRKDDPCISVCQFDGKTGWCLGCGRTVPEIRAWKKLTPFRRTALTRELPRRVEQLAGAPAGGDEAVGRGRKDAARPRKIVSAVVALVIALVSVMPLVLAAGHEARDGAVTHVATVDAHGQAGDHHATDDLRHHAEAHAQGVMPTTPDASAAGVGAAVTFPVKDVRDRGNDAGRGPFEPPRA